MPRWGAAALAPGMTGNEPSQGARPRRAWRVNLSVEIVSAAVLSVATLFTSWSGYQSALWDGEQASAYTEASALRTEAAQASTRAGQVEGVDALLFSQWLDAYAGGDDRLQGFYRERFRPEFSRAVDAWLALEPVKHASAPQTPFAMPQYRPAAREEAQRLQRQADAAFQIGQHANQISDAFVAATVILASAMFFGGICQTFQTGRVRLVLTAVAVLTCAWGVIRTLALPAN